MEKYVKIPLIFSHQVTVHSPLKASTGYTDTQVGQENEQFLVSSAAETKAEKQEKRADRANYGELQKDFTSVSA